MDEKKNDTDYDAIGKLTGKIAGLIIRPAIVLCIWNFVVAAKIINCNITFSYWDLFWILFAVRCIIK